MCLQSNVFTYLYVPLLITSLEPPFLPLKVHSKGYFSMSNKFISINIKMVCNIYVAWPQTTKQEGWPISLSKM